LLELLLTLIFSLDLQLRKGCITDEVSEALTHIEDKFTLAADFTHYSEKNEVVY
jgi:hypothetical protein